MIEYATTWVIHRHSIHSVLHFSLIFLLYTTGITQNFSKLTIMDKLSLVSDYCTTTIVLPMSWNVKGKAQPEVETGNRKYEK